MAKASKKSPPVDKSDTDDSGENPVDGTPEDENEDEIPSAPPSGMVRRNANDAAGWVAKFKGHVVYGVLLGRFTRSGVGDDGEVKHYYQLKLLAPCKVALPVEERTDDDQTKDAIKGEVVNLDENKGLENLNEAIKEGGTQVAWIKFVGKKVQQKNRSRKFWEIEVYTQKRAAPF